jgi:hypothetical protein
VNRLAAGRTISGCPIAHGRNRLKYFFSHYVVVRLVQCLSHAGDLQPLVGTLFQSSQVELALLFAIGLLYLIQGRHVSDVQ